MSVDTVETLFIIFSASVENITKAAGHCRQLISDIYMNVSI